MWEIPKSSSEMFKMLGLCALNNVFPFSTEQSSCQTFGQRRHLELALSSFGIACQCCSKDVTTFGFLFGIQSHVQVWICRVFESNWSSKALRRESKALFVTLETSESATPEWKVEHLLTRETWENAFDTKCFLDVTAFKKPCSALHFTCWASFGLQSGGNQRNHRQNVLALPQLPQQRFTSDVQTAWCLKAYKLWAEHDATTLKTNGRDWTFSFQCWKIFTFI